jgi:hypothetical protein
MDCHGVAVGGGLLPDDAAGSWRVSGGRLEPAPDERPTDEVWLEAHTVGHKPMNDIALPGWR